MHLSESKQILRNTYLFKDLNEIHLDLILMICEEMNVVAGQEIFHIDQPGDALYIIARGSVEIVLDPPGAQPLRLSVLEAGQIFGETVLIEEGRRSASARCLHEGTLLRIAGERLARLSENYPEIGFRIMRRMAAELMNKLREANQNLRALAEKSTSNPAKP